MVLPIKRRYGTGERCRYALPGLNGASQGRPWA